MDPATRPLHEERIRMCMDEAAAAIAGGDPPFGAVLCDAAGSVVARAHYTQVSTSDPTAHGEINILRLGGAIRGGPDLAGWQLYSNAEPCSMCMSAIVKARIALLVYGAPHERHLGPYLPVVEVVARTKAPPVIVAGVLAEACAAQIEAARDASPAVD
jgi:tRNA(adenine34) deaminase